MNGSAVSILLAIVPACGAAGSASDSAVPAAPACAADTGGEPAPTWAEWGAPFFTGWCQPCHASDAPQRYGAPPTATFDTEADARAQAAAIRATVLDARTMPIGGGLSDGDRARLDAWLCAIEEAP